MAEEFADMKGWLSPSVPLLCVHPKDFHQWCDGMYRLHWNSQYKDGLRPGKWPDPLVVWVNCFASQGIFFLALIALSEIFLWLDVWQRAGWDAVTVGYLFVYFKMEMEWSELIWVWHEVMSCVCPLSVRSLERDPNMGTAFQETFPQLTPSRVEQQKLCL